MNKNALTWLLIGAAGLYLFNQAKQRAALTAGTPGETFDPVHNSDFQFNDFQFRFGSPVASTIAPETLFNGDIQSALGFYTTLGDTRRTGYDILTSRSNNIPIV